MAVQAVPFVLLRYATRLTEDQQAGADGARGGLAESVYRHPWARGLLGTAMTQRAWEARPVFNDFTDPPR
jgi:hypothetical protein